MLLSYYLGLGEKDLANRFGEIGIEVEVEGRNLPGSDPKRQWRIVREGSLRGEGLEYNSIHPMPVELVQTKVEYLWGLFRNNNSTLRKSDRCGVHVHINCQDMTLSQVHIFQLTYLLLEDLLFRFCDDSRDGNLFCMKVSDSSDLLFRIRDSISNNSFDQLNVGHIRYSAMNISSLFKYGSLEFRQLETPTQNPKKIVDWAKILYNIKEASLRYRSRMDLLNDITRIGEDEFLKKIFPPELYKKVCNKDQEEVINESMKLMYYLFFVKRGEKKTKKKNPIRSDPVLVGRLTS